MASKSVFFYIWVQTYFSTSLLNLNIRRSQLSLSFVTTNGLLSPRDDAGRCSQKIGDIVPQLLLSLLFLFFLTLWLSMFPLSFYGEKKVHIRELSPMSLIHLFFRLFRNIRSASHSESIQFQAKAERKRYSTEKR